MLLKFLRKKSLIPDRRETHLHRSLTTFDLILFGIGAIIGAGVFILTGIAAATKAGPAVTLSYAIAGIASLFAALAYAELSSSIGGSGSAYSYAYAGFGEFFAWLIGWDLILEYSLSTATVAVGWSGYVNNFLQSIGVNLPTAITNTPFQGGVINLLSIFIILALAILLCIGTKQSARFNAVIVFIKLITIAVFIFVAAQNIHTEYWGNYFPYGFKGIMSGAALVFFAFIGFDALSTAVEETIDPQHSLPVAIVVSLLICTGIYIIVAALLTGIAPYTTLNVRSPVAEALLNLGYRSAAGIVAAGATAGLTTVMLVMYYALTRICLAMARDGLLPKKLVFIHKKTFTPIPVILATGIVMASIAGFVPLTQIAELVNIGTLAAFIFVCIGVIVFRYQHPDLHRPFKLPWNPLIPLLGVLSCLYLMLHLPYITWLRFIIWMLIGLGIYARYSMKHSKLNKEL